MSCEDHARLVALLRERLPAGCEVYEVREHGFGIGVLMPYDGQEAVEDVLNAVWPDRRALDGHYTDHYVWVTYAYLTPAAVEHRALTLQLLALQDDGTKRNDDAEEVLLSRLDALWEQLTEEERETERKLAAAWAVATERAPSPPETEP